MISEVATHGNDAHQHQDSGYPGRKGERGDEGQGNTVKRDTRKQSLRHPPRAVGAWEEMRPLGCQEMNVLSGPTMLVQNFA